MTTLEIEIIAARHDNYIYLLFESATGTSGVVDPADADPVIEVLHTKGLGLQWILNTHHHDDHIGGNKELVATFGAKIVGPRADARRIPNMDLLVGEGDVFAFGAQEVQVLETPGHTSGHITFWFEQDEALFCGDTLFSLGCGRVFEGTAQQMHASLQKFAEMPDSTRVFCGHEYTQANARFATSVDPNNPDLAKRRAEIDALRRAQKPTIPTTLGLERKTNPFLRTADDSILAQLGLSASSEVEVFTELRRRKDVF